MYCTNQQHSVCNTNVSRTSQFKKTVLVLGFFVDSAHVFTNTLDSLMKELPSVSDVPVDSRRVPVDYQMADTTLHHKFDLDNFLKRFDQSPKNGMNPKTNNLWIWKKSILHRTFALSNLVEWERPS